MGKLGLMRAWGFNVTELTVVDALRDTQNILEGYLGRSIAQLPLSEQHVLRVIYEENEEVVVVTLSPGRRGRYEA